jgi:hypothetical protein
MNNRKKIFDPKKTQPNYFTLLSTWCGENRLFVRTNSEVFFINERVLMKPEFIINESVYIDLVEMDQLNSKYDEYCRLFSQSYGTIIVIPKEVLLNINSITKKDVESKFGVKF